ncbi:hypothetical protein JMJ77_0011698, partial [Colletotrichum scovillei]
MGHADPLRHAPASVSSADPSTCDHTRWRTRDPVRSLLDKPA